MQSGDDYRQQWVNHFDAVFADEYQDVNFAQYSWLRLLCAGHSQLFAVGDDGQSIYSWRGSDLSLMRRFTQDFPSASIFRLEENFRSTAHILAAANAVIARDTQRLGKHLTRARMTATAWRSSHSRMPTMKRIVSLLG